MNQRLLRSILYAGLGIAAVAAMIYFLTPAGEMRRLRQHKHDLSVASDLREVASGCLTLIQSGAEDLITLPSPSDPMLPAAIRSKNPSQVSIDSNARTVTIEFGGGRFHYGYLFEPVSTGKGKWQLLLFGEEPDDVHELLRL